MIQYSDTHCHLNFDSFEKDLHEVLSRAWDAGITRILIPGSDLETSRMAVKLADKHPNLYAAVGVHPNSSNEWDKSHLSELRCLAQHPRVLAMGEIGLDYYRDHAPRPLQQEVFKAQLELAFEVKKPVILHNRQSSTDMMDILIHWIEQQNKNEHPLLQHPGVLHSFSGEPNLAEEALKMGFFLGISGPVTFQNSQQLQKTVAGLPIGALLTETDSPYLTPHPHRGTRNEPSYIPFIAQKIAQLTNMDLPQVAQELSKNANTLFNWGMIS